VGGEIWAKSCAEKTNVSKRIIQPGRQNRRGEMVLDTSGNLGGPDDAPTSVAKASVVWHGTALRFGYVFIIIYGEFGFSLLLLC
jgi:hypothetical protein